MRPVSLILVCGQSLFLLAVEAALATLPEMAVVRYPLRFPLSVAQIAALHPVVVVMEWEGGANPALFLALLQHGIPLLIVDAGRPHAHLLRSHEVDLTGVPDLAGLLATLHT